MSGNGWPLNQGTVPTGSGPTASDPAGTCAHVSTNGGGQLQGFSLSGRGLPAWAR